MALPAPTGLLTSATSSSITLSCDPELAAQHYVWWINGRQVEITALNAYTFTGLAAGTQYLVGVSWSDGNTTSVESYTTARTAALEAPQGLRVVSATPTSITITVLPELTANRYGWWLNGRLLSVTAAPGPSTAPTHTFTGLIPSTRYILGATWGDASGAGSLGATITGATSSAPPPPGPLPKPTLLAPTGITQTSFTIACSPEPGANRYGWWLNHALVAVTAGPSHTFTGLTPGTLYVVQATWGTATNSSYGSDPWVVPTPGPTPPPPPLPTPKGSSSSTALWLLGGIAGAVAGVVLYERAHRAETPAQPPILP